MGDPVASIPCVCDVLGFKLSCRQPWSWRFRSGRERAGELGLGEGGGRDPSTQPAAVLGAALGFSRRVFFQAGWDWARTSRVSGPRGSGALFNRGFEWNVCEYLPR